MSKIFQTSFLLDNIHKKIMDKILDSRKCSNNEFVVKVWRSAKKKSNSGQIFGEKILPNGNIQRRVTTVYAGKSSKISTDTRVYSPNGELLNAYHGIRGNALKKISDGKVIEDIEPIKSYASNSNKDICSIISQEMESIPDLIYIHDFPKR